MNSGVMDLLLNFMCSAKAAKIDLSDTLVYVGQASDIKLVENLGVYLSYFDFDLFWAVSLITSLYL